MADILMPVTGMRRIVLFFLLGSIVVILIASLTYRMKNPALIVEGRSSGAMQQESGGMNPEIGKLMEKLQQNPNDIATMIHLTEHLVSDQNWPMAETFASRAAAADPANSQPMYLLGIIQHNQGKHAEAASSLERVVSLKDDASVRYSLGVLYIHYLNNSKKGIEHLTVALHSPTATDELKKHIREELEKAPLAHAQTPAKETAPEKSQVKENQAKEASAANKAKVQKKSATEQQGTKK